jgi:hypothetical protein
MQSFLEQVQGLMLPYAQASDVLSVLPPLDASALELGMRQFLDEVDGLGQCLAAVRDGTSVYPWVAAVAAAATACEIARRQLRPADRASRELNRTNGFPPEGLFLR